MDVPSVFIDKMSSTVESFHLFVYSIFPYMIERQRPVIQPLLRMH